MIERLTTPCGDDWLVRLTCRRDGKTWMRWVGVNASSDREAAIRAAKIHVNTPRRVFEGHGCEIVDVEICRMHEWRARQLGDGAPMQYAAEVGHWQGAAA